jgi:plasmid maintenance system antidote protein VapI
MTMEHPLLRPKPKPTTPLARWLRRTGYTGSELARAVGVDKAAISRIVNSGGPMSDDLANRIKKVTGLKRL